MQKCKMILPILPNSEVGYIKSHLFTFPPEKNKTLDKKKKVFLLSFEVNPKEAYWDKN